MSMEMADWITKTRPEELAEQMAEIGPTKDEIIPFESVAERTAAAMVTQSRWFMVTPLPDGMWRFTTKDE